MNGRPGSWQLPRWLMRIWLLATMLAATRSIGGRGSAVGAHASSPRPRIYLYPEDPKVMEHRPFESLNVTFYGLDVVFFDQLKHSPYVEADPEKADYFYLPVYQYWKNPHPLPEREMVQYLRSKGPWFDRNKGADHIFAWPGDFARCEWGGWGDLDRSILLHHFGKVYNGDEPRVNPCDPLQGWGDACDPIIGSFRRIRKEGLAGYRPCHHMGQDIVVPPTPWEHPHLSRHLNPHLNITREDLVFFAGPVNLHHAAHPDHNPNTPWSDGLYSFGTRQSFVKMFHNTPGVRIFEKHIDNYFEQLSKAKFCLAAAGWGWGGRMKFAVIHGCIPVIVQDGVLVEFEEQVPMHEYALRIPMWLLHKLPETLEVLVRLGVADKMYRALDCVWRLHWWSAPHGRAFDLIMCELRTRTLAPGTRLHLDTKTCSMTCGDGVVINLRGTQQG